MSILLHQATPWNLKSGGRHAEHQSEVWAEGHMGPIALVGIHRNMAGRNAERFALDNAKFIIRAVNSHYDLLKVAAQSQNYIKYLTDLDSGLCGPEDGQDIFTNLTNAIGNAEKEV